MEGSNEEKNGKATEGRGSIVKGGETQFGRGVLVKIPWNFPCMTVLWKLLNAFG